MIAATFDTLADALECAKIAAQPHEVIEARIRRPDGVTIYRAAADWWPELVRRVTTVPPPYTYLPHTKGRRTTTKKRLRSLGAEGLRS